MNNLSKNWKKVSIEISNHKLIYLFLFAILIGGLFIRTYRTDQILGFYYDQGRDALKVWDFWHKGDIMLIGPTTGIAGILRGPFYFYLIAPFYLMSRGSPILPAYMLAFSSMLAVLLAYYLGYKIHSRSAGLFAAIISAFSFYMMVAARWLSNPTPMLLLSMILVWFMLIITKEKDKRSSKVGWSWVLIALVSGLSLWHFGSSGEFFYFPALGIFFLWQLGLFNRKSRKNWKSNIPKINYLLLAVLAFGFTMSPLILFDFMNNHLLSTNIKTFLFEGESFKSDFQVVFADRMHYFYNTFLSKVFISVRDLERNLLIILTISFVAFMPRYWKNDGVKTLILLLLSPVVGMLFFQGNQGNIYDYYMTGYYMIFILFLAVVLGELWKYSFGKIFVTVFVFTFLSNNLPIVKARNIAGVDGPTTVAFGNQMQAAAWIFNDANGRDFNVDFYVPPVIPHSYDYLFTWLGSNKFDNVPVTERIDLLYTLYEEDPPHPERLEAWMARQAGIGSIEETEKFGGITVSRRKRLLYE